MLAALCLSLFLAGGSRVFGDTRADELYSPLRIQIKIKKDVFRTGDPVNGTVIIENTYPAALPAVFNIRLFHDGTQSSELITAIKRVPSGKTVFSFKNFGIPRFNSGPGAEGVWRIRISQQSRDSFAVEVTLRIVAPATPKDKPREKK